MYVANQDANVLYQNDGFGTFTDITAIAGVGTGATSDGTASGDFDNAEISIFMLPITAVKISYIRIMEMAHLRISR